MVPEQIAACTAARVWDEWAFSPHELRDAQDPVVVDERVEILVQWS
jgi:hypothetical protein